MIGTAEPALAAQAQTSKRTRPVQGFGDGWTDYPYPLRPNFTARLILPVDLTSEEAARLRAFLLSLATMEAKNAGEE
jgi:hypothetical protein